MVTNVTTVPRLISARENTPSKVLILAENLILDGRPSPEYYSMKKISQKV
jgi:hypothetical protein